MLRHLYAAALAVTLSLTVAIPVMAGGERTVRFTSSDSFSRDHACGVVEEATIDIKGTAFFDAGGQWLRDILVFSVRAEFTGPSGSLTTSSQQVAEFTPETGTLRGQGTFIHGGRIGVLVYDVGRLVFDSGDGSTLFATPNVIPFDDPNVGAAIDAALCEAIG
jgi:hypothetical protein